MEVPYLVGQLSQPVRLQQQRGRAEEETKEEAKEVKKEGGRRQNKEWEMKVGLCFKRRGRRKVKMQTQKQQNKQLDFKKVVQ